MFWVWGRQNLYSLRNISACACIALWNTSGSLSEYDKAFEIAHPIIQDIETKEISSQHLLSGKTPLLDLNHFTILLTVHLFLSSSKCSYIYELHSLKSIISDYAEREQYGFYKLQWIQLCVELLSGVIEWVTMANVKWWLVRLQPEVFMESFADGHLPEHRSFPCCLSHSRIFSALTLCLPLGYNSNNTVFLTQLWQLPGPHTANPWRPVFHSPHTVILLALQQLSYLCVPYSNCSRTFLTSSMANPLKWELMILSISLSIHPAACKNVWSWMKQSCSKLWKFNQHNIIIQIEAKRLYML